jgi:hypothetical protein
VTYLDANVIIRLLEGDTPTRAMLKGHLQGSPADFATSELSMLECRCRPLKLADTALLKLYDEFFASADMHLLPVQPCRHRPGYRVTRRYAAPDARCSSFGDGHDAQGDAFLHRRPPFQGHFPDGH